MPKPIKIRGTTNPIGLKFHQIMAEKQIEGDYKALADAFGVKTPSVYDWIDHARIGKDKYRRLVEWSGRSLHWWFDIEAQTHDLVPAAVAREPSVVYSIKSRHSSFPRSFEAYKRLSEEDKGRVDGYIAGLIDAREGNGSHKLEPRNGTGQLP